MGVPKDTLFRSCDMSLTQLYMAKEIGREVVSALGEVEEVQFRDVSALCFPMDSNTARKTFVYQQRGCNVDGILLMTFSV